ncbi:MAG: bifunctional [glutamate--ammonia ligase]-adenylyl-L-tyrosine phosphorylase/[glutamate--ammonia-ligase] adenylyltransferase [Limisphaerales bacterium]
MQSNVLSKAIEACADPNRAQSVIDRLAETSAASLLKKIKADQANIICALLAGSAASGELLVAHPDWMPALLEPGALDRPRLAQGLKREVEKWLKPLLKSDDYATALSTLREFKQRDMLRIAARDLARIGDTNDIMLELSNLADVCVEAVYQICWQQLTQRFGSPYHLDADDRWQPTTFSIIGLGKLGGQELNYSSDIDVIFIYSDEGYVFKTPPHGSGQTGKGLNNHQFFIRLSEAIVAEIGKLTSEGMLFRIDLRLRPEGNAGPLARSLDSYENYYAQWGQTWERMMLIKARPVAGNVSLGMEFVETIHPFRYPRSISGRTLQEIAAIKKRIEIEVVKSGELDRNVKLGRGGIREIEFIAQTLQILHAGHTPFLQGSQTLPTLGKLNQYEHLKRTEVQELTEAYLFLRDLEHRLQMEAHQQTHTIPTERKARERLARLTGFETLAKFEKARADHSGRVRAIYDKVLGVDGDSQAKPLPDDEDERAWKKLLADHAFRDPDQALKMVHVFLRGPGYVHVSARTVELARQLLPKFLARCPRPDHWPENALSDPDRVLVRIDSFITAYGARAVLYEMWAQKASLFELLLMLFDRSEFLAETAIRTPDLVDELEVSGRLRRSKTADEILKDLRYGLQDEDQHEWIRRYHQAEFMRIGLREILGLADFEQNMVELSALAQACLQYAVDVVTAKNKLKAAPFCIIGLGKLGGQEITYGSDLDIVFVADTNTKNLPALQKLATQVLDLLSKQTERGIVFETDARLRPDGEKGLLVNTLDAYEEYYRKRAALWEIQSLTRIRPVAGDMQIGEQFQKLTTSLSDFSKPQKIAAFTPDWKSQIVKMRERIAKERTPRGEEALAIKTGNGGLVDAEFMAQMFCLEGGWSEPNTLKALVRANETKRLPDGDEFIKSYRALRRIECILRRWSFEGETTLPNEDAPLYRVAVRCGFKTVDDFMKHVGQIRSVIHNGYKAVFK